MKRWFRWLGGVLLLLALLVLFLPTLLAQRSVQAWIIDELLAQEGIAAEVESVQLGWFSPTEVRGLSLGPTGRPQLVNIQRITSDRTFWTGLWEGMDVGDLEIAQPRIHLWFAGDQSNLDFPRPPAADSQPQAAPAKSRELALQVTDAELWLKTDTMPQELQILQQVQVAAQLEKGPQGRTLTLSPGTLVDHAEISPDVCAGGLKYIVPVLAEAAWTKGEFSLELESCVIDLDRPEASLVSGKLHIHGIEAGIKNRLIAAAGKQLIGLFGREALDTIHLADNSTVAFQLRDGSVWHDGVEVGLPRVDPSLVVRTSGSVTLDEQLDLEIELPIPLKLLADGPLAQAFADNALKLRAQGTLQQPEIKIQEGDLVGNLIQSFTNEERPLEGVLEGVQALLDARRQARDARRNADETQGDDASGDSPEAEIPFLDRFRERREQGGGVLDRFRSRLRGDPPPEN